MGLRWLSCEPWAYSHADSWLVVCSHHAVALRSLGPRIYGPLPIGPCAFSLRSSCRRFLMAEPYSSPRVNNAILSGQMFILEGPTEPEPSLPTSIAIGLAALLADRCPLRAESNRDAGAAFCRQGPKAGMVPAAVLAIPHLEAGISASDAFFASVE